jgi:sulfane dehydrogenase subunit SoxC
VFLGVGGLAAASTLPAHAADPLPMSPWMQFPGAGMSGYGSPATYESNVTRTLIQSRPGTTGSGAARTPIEALDGMITPSGLHFERHHSGVPDIDPDTHRLLIHAPLDLHRGGAAALPDGLTPPLPRMLGQ